jgi:hypothetical protein
MMTLWHWIALARWFEEPLDDKRPLPEELRRALRGTADEVRRLATLREPAPELKKALAENAAELRRLQLDQPKLAEVEKALVELAAKRPRLLEYEELKSVELENEQAKEMAKTRQLEQRELAKIWPEYHEALGVRQDLMRRMGMTPWPATIRVVSAMARVAGVTAGDLAEFRAIERESRATHLLDEPAPWAPREKREFIEERIADLAGVDSRTLRRWRRRTYRRMVEEVPIEDLRRRKET